MYMYGLIFKRHPNKAKWNRKFILSVDTCSYCYGFAAAI